MIGIGLNVDTAADELGPASCARPPTSLRIAAGGAGRPRAGSRRPARARSAGVARPRSASQRRAVDRLPASATRSTGSAIAWTRGQHAHEGEARGIDDDGALVVFTGDGGGARSTPARCTCVR